MADFCCLRFVSRGKSFLMSVSCHSAAGEEWLHNLYRKRQEIAEHLRFFEDGALHTWSLGVQAYLV